MIQSSADTAASHDVNDLRSALLYRIRRSAAIPQDVDDLIAAVRADSQPAWQPIATFDDTKYTEVLVAHDTEGYVGEARYNGDEGWWWINNDPTDSWGSRIYPTHWMPLPAPPAIGRE